MERVDDLQLAFDTSDLAAELALAHFESGVSATLKADGSEVTEADHAVERLLRETLSEARPGGRSSDRGGGMYSNAGLHSQLLASLHYPARYREF